MSSLSRKKLFIYLVLGLLVLGIIGFFLYRLLSPSITPTAPGGQGGIGGRILPYPGDIPGAQPGGAPGPTTTPESFLIPDHPAQRLIRITDFPVVSPSLNKEENKIVFYKKDGGDLFSADLNGSRQTKISNITILGLMDAVWSPVRDRAAVFYLDQDTIKGFLHIGTSSVAVLPTDITSAAWSPDGKSLAYTKREGDFLNLVISDAAARSPKTVFRTPVRDSRITWVDVDRIAFATPASGMAEGFLFSYSRRTGVFEKVAGPVFGLQALWSPYDAHLILSSTPRGGSGLTTKVFNPFDPERKDLKQLDAATLAEKCVWGGKQELWCAVPRDWGEAALLPDLYLSGEFNSSDRIVRIDLEKNITDELFNQGDFDVSNLLLTKDKNYLFFVDRRDGLLWGLKLK